MGWFNYYKLLAKYSGDLSKATAEEMEIAKKYTPDDIPAAQKEAEKRYNELSIDRKCRLRRVYS